MNKRRAYQQLIGCTAAISGCLVLDVADASAPEALRDDLGHTDWEEVGSGYFIAAELVYQQDNLVVFDIFTDSQLHYVRLAGDCDAMLVKELRVGGISGSEVEFADVSTWTEPQDASTKQPQNLLLTAACEQRES